MIKKKNPREEQLLAVNLRKKRVMREVFEFDKLKKVFQRGIVYLVSHLNAAYIFSSCSRPHLLKSLTFSQLKLQM